jgi:hypothetical protein
MKKFVLILFAAVSISAFAADATVKGYLVDLQCAAEEKYSPSFAATHKKACMQMDDCAASGYGVLTADKKLVKFDKAGNERAKKFIADLKKERDIRVNVIGNVKGDTIAVSKIELQQ